MQKVFTGNAVLDSLNHEIERALPSKIFFLVDENTHAFCMPVILGELSELKAYEILEIEPGEESKSVEIAMNLWTTLAELGADRNTLIINVGGGVVTDLGGFVASTYKRGINFFNVPTSLLGMVDAAIGGKTGVDVEGIKNLAGTFSPAEATFVHIDFLETLPDEQLRSGFAEVLKHALIQDKNYWAEVQKAWKTANFKSVVAKSIAIKSAIVAEDEKETGLRKTLNFGHTLGHAIESYFLEKGETVFHGEAVAAGMLLASKLSTAKCGFSNDEFDEVQRSISSIFRKLIWEKSEEEHILKWLAFDKKNQNDTFQFVLLEEIGKAIYDVPISLEEVEDVLKWYREDLAK